MSGASELTVDEVMEVACTMAQELKALKDAMSKRGIYLPSVKLLLKDFDAINKRWNGSLINTLVKCRNLNCLGEYQYVGELMSALNSYPESTSFGFLNQPAQKLYELNFNKNLHLAFKQT